MPPNTALEDAIRKQEEALSDVISREGWFWWKADPELFKVLGVIQGHLGEIRRLHILRQGERHYDVAAVDYRLAELLSRDVGTLNVRSGWEYADGLYRLLFVVGDRHYVFPRLFYEYKRLEQHSDSNYGYVSKFFDMNKICHLLAAYGEGRVEEKSWQHRLAVEYLTLLSSSINDLGRHRVAGRELKAQYLNRLTMVLALVLMLTLILIYLVSGGPGGGLRLNPFGLLKALLEGRGVVLDLSREAFWHAVASGVLGALGGVLSGFLKLRDELSRIDDIRSFRSAMWAQPFVGASVGVVLYLIIQGGLLGFQINGGGLRWAVLMVLAFVAGYSEPFWLGVVSRVAGAADKSAERKQPPDKAKPS